MSSYDQLQAFNSIGLVAGVILGVAALFDLANFLYEELVAFFYLAILMTLGLVGLFSYSTVYTYWRPCVPGLNIIPMDITIGQTMNKSVFSADDGQMIGVFVLQILTALCLLGAAFDFYRRGYRVFMSRITYGY
ncbi:hypothetical protein HDE_06672 [Halotydeus destructor]|nr:hypothetical protein HDE_06672 [Halotydeus destructor]